MKTLHFVSTGDEARDLEIAKQLRASDECIARSECPNGDGLLIASSGSAVYECPQCGFVYVGVGLRLGSGRDLN